MKSNSTRRRRKPSARPKKPYPDYPLYAHPTGYWSKKINGKILSFGRWGRVVKGVVNALPYEEGWQAALAAYKARVDDVHAGRIRETVVKSKPVAVSEGLTIGAVCNRFLAAKMRQRDAGEITARTFEEYRQATDRLVAEFGAKRLVDDLVAEDFEHLRAAFAKQYGPVRLAKVVQLTRTIFKYGFESGLMDKPARFGPQFKKPSASVMRKHRAKSAKRLFSAEEIRWLLDGKTVKDDDGNDKFLAGASVQLRAMVLLGLNCGFGNSDVSDLPQSALDLKGGWITFPRPKTGIERRCALWPETVAALKAAIAERPYPNEKADGDCVFITAHGNRWVRVRVTTKERGDGKEPTTTTAQINAVGLEFGKVMRRLGINGRAGVGFYSLRHTFRTVADATKDFPAVRLVMGHVDSSIDGVYREGIDDDRLGAVAAHVRTWLFGAGV